MCWTIMTNSKDTKRHLPDHTKWCIRFCDIRGSEIRDVISSPLQHINRDVKTHTNTHTLEWVSLCAVSCASEDQAFCALSKQLFCPLRTDTVFQKVKTYFYLCTAFKQSFCAITLPTVIRELAKVWGGGRPSLSCSAMASAGGWKQSCSCR